MLPGVLAAFLSLLLGLIWGAHVDTSSAKVLYNLRLVCALIPQVLHSVAGPWPGVVSQEPVSFPPALFETTE